MGAVEGSVLKVKAQCTQSVGSQGTLKTRKEGKYVGLPMAIRKAAGRIDGIK